MCGADFFLNLKKNVADKKSAGVNAKKAPAKRKAVKKAVKNKAVKSK